LSPEQRQLLAIIDSLSDEDRVSVKAFAEFLQFRSSAKDSKPLLVDTEVVVAEVLDIPRPEKESVIRAMKRLAKTYPSLDRARVLNPASALMNAHILEGRDAKAVIDDLEQLFRSTYEAQTN